MMLGQGQSHGIVLLPQRSSVRLGSWGGIVDIFGINA